MMIELLAGAGLIIFCLVAYVKHLRGKVKGLKNDLKAAQHFIKVQREQAQLVKQRLEERDETVKQRVEAAEDEDFNDFFGPNS